MEQILKISEFIIKSFLHIWPYLLITIPLAVVVNFTGTAKYINKALTRNPFLSIILATAVGAISPFCSCGVIPVITSLLIGGVPLGPVMSFWIASPSMDPEIFLLSVATIGWKLSVWRLAATFIISISAGILTHLAQKKGFFGGEILRSNQHFVMNKIREGIFAKLRGWYMGYYRSIRIKRNMVMQLSGIQTRTDNSTKINCCFAAKDLKPQIENHSGCQCNDLNIIKNQTLPEQILMESWKSFSMVARFMMLAFFINALIKFYIPEHIISDIIGGDSTFSVLIAALIGIPFYTTNITALPLVSGLISLGMNQGAALTFLIAGPVTTLPAMMAVWGIVKPRVFFVFLSFGLLGSIIFGYLYNLIY
jgi:uncharacterized protein